MIEYGFFRNGKLIETVEARTRNEALDKSELSTRKDFRRSGLNGCYIGSAWIDLKPLTHGN